MLRQLPWPVTAEECEFGLALTRMTRRFLFESLSHLVPPQNSLAFTHGSEWTFRREDSSDHDGRFELVAASKDIPFDRIVANDLSLLREFMVESTGTLGLAMTRKVCETASNAAADVGNVVSLAQSGSWADAVRDMLKKIAFGVDSDGNVTIPSLYIPQDIWPKFIEELERQGPEFEQEISQIKSEKTREALEQEKQRRARYKSPEASR